MDKNGDGQVRKEEMTAAVALLEEVSRGQVLLGVADRGVLLFGNLDTNGNGRLGVRELRTASERLTAFDRNGDGQITAAEIPHRFDWFLSQAPLPLGIQFRGNPRGGMAERLRTPPAAVRSGSRRWTGTVTATSRPANFSAPGPSSSALDTNGDGLIEAAEAK